jgi:hypothetical protein
MEDVDGSGAYELLQEVAATFDDNVPNLYRMLARSQVALSPEVARASTASSLTLASRASRAITPRQ